MAQQKAPAYTEALLITYNLQLKTQLRASSLRTAVQTLITSP